jgi:hypothetical protein
VPDHPVQLAVSDDLHRSRLTVFFRLLLAIPLIIWLALWSIGVFFAAIIAWFAALFTGRLPQGLHDFFGMYVRYATHLGAYLGLAANPYPGFTGQPGYPVDVSIPERQRQSRWKAAFRLFLAIPALMLAAVLGSGFGGGGGGYSQAESDAASAAEWFGSTGVGGVAAVCAFLGWFAALATGRMPLGLRNLGAYGLGYTAQAYAYVLLLTDRYPNSDPEAIGPEWALPPHRVRLELADDGRRSRLTVFFRLLLAIPHFVWLTLWTIAALLAAIANWLVALFRGRSAEALHRFLAAYVRYTAHVTAFVTLVANPFPGFVGAPGYPVDIVIGPPERQNRWITFFRTLLAIPSFFLSGALSAVLVVISILGWFAALVTGRMPTGLRNLGAYAVRYLAQTNAYWFIVTDAYPHASPALRPPPEPEPVPHSYYQPQPEPEQRPPTFDEPEAV